MTTERARPRVLLIKGSVYAVPKCRGMEDDVLVCHIPVGRQPRLAPLRIAKSALDALIEAGDGVLIDGFRPIAHATRGSRDRRNASAWRLCASAIR